MTIPHPKLWISGLSLTTICLLALWAWRVDSPESTTRNNEEKINHRLSAVERQEHEVSRSGNSEESLAALIDRAATTDVSTLSWSEIHALADQLIGELKRAGFGSHEITIYLRQPGSLDSRIALAVLDSLSSPNESTAYSFISEIATRNFDEALELVKGYPVGKKFERSLTYLIMALKPDDDSAQSKLSRVLNEFPDSADRESVTDAIRGWIFVNADDLSVRSLISISENHVEYGDDVSSAALIAIVRNQSVRGSDLVALIDGMPEHIVKRSYLQICADLMKNGMSPGDVIEFAKSSRDLSRELTPIAISTALGNSIARDADIRTAAMALGQSDRFMEYADTIAITAVTSPERSKAILEGLPNRQRDEIISRMLPALKAREMDNVIDSLLEGVSDPAVRMKLANEYRN